MVALISVSTLQLFANDNTQSNWVLVGIDENIKVYFSDEKGNRLSEVFLASEIDSKIEEVNTSVSPFWSANAGETTQYLTSAGSPIIVPIIRRSDTNEIVACMQSGAHYPNYTEYEGLGDPYHDDNILGIMYYGDVNSGIPELAQQYGLDWYKAHYGWQVALWRVLKQQGYPVNPYDYMNLQGDDTLINYINELSSHIFSNVTKNFEINFDGNISQENPQKTNAIGITESLNYSVKVSDGVHVESLSGEQINTFNANEQFIVVAPPNFKANVTVTVKTEQKVFTTIIYKAQIAGVQHIGQFGSKDPFILQKDLLLDFKGAYDIIDITKRTQDKEFLPNTMYEVADNLNFEQAQKFTTDEKGNIHLEEFLLAGEVLYLREYSAPIVDEHHGYNISPGISEIKGIGGDTHVLEFENKKIKGKICINKTDRDNKPLHNVQFDLLTHDGRFLDSKTTDINGKVCFEDLELGLYKIVERTPDNYTDDQLVYDVDVKINEELITQGQNSQSDYEANVLLEIVNEKIVRYNPELHTVATGINGEKDFKANTDIQFIDYVEYTDIVPNREYTLTGVIMDKATGEPLLVDNKEVTATTVFTPTKSSGLAEVYYKLNTAGLENKDLVVFETLKQGEDVIVKHHDINDTGQTIHIRDNMLPAAGQQVIESLAVGVIILATSALSLLYFRKRGKQDVAHD